MIDSIHYMEYLLNIIIENEHIYNLSYVDVIIFSYLFVVVNVPTGCYKDSLY